MAGGGTTADGSFRYPYQHNDITEHLRAEFDRIGIDPEVSRQWEALTMDRDRALEDYLTRGIENAGGTGRITALTVAAADSPDVFRATADYVCDGTDDNVEIQAAIDALIADPTALFQGAVVLAPGIYHTSNYLVLHGITLMGLSALRDSVIFRDNNGPVIGDSTFEGNGFSIRNLAVTSQDSPCILLDQSFSPQVTIANCSIGGVGGTATGNGHLQVEGTSGSCNLMITDSFIGPGGSDTYAIYAPGASISSGSGINSVLNTVINGGGFYAFGAFGLFVEGCTIGSTSSNTASLHLGNATSCRIVNNAIGATAGNVHGILLSAVSADNLIQGNIISGWNGTGDGLRITNGTRENVQNNIFIGTGTNGINLVAGTNCTVAHNDLTQATGTNRFTDSGTSTTTYAGNRPLAGNATPGGSAGGFLAGTYPNPTFSSSAFSGSGDATTAARGNHNHDAVGDYSTMEKDQMFWASVYTGGFH